MITKSINLNTYPVGDFVDNTANWLRKSMNGTPSEANIVAGVGRDGGNALAMQFVAGSGITPGSTTFGDYANSAYRAELATYIEGGWESLKFPDPTWFAFSIKLPDDYEDVGNGYDEIIAQLHVGFGTPAIYLSIRDGVLGVYRGSLKRAAFNPTTQAVTDDGTYATREFGGWKPMSGLQPGRWYDIAIHLVPATYSGDLGSEYLNNDGELDVYVNHVLLHTEQGAKTTPNFWNSSGLFLRQYLKFGVYVSSWNPSNWGGAVSLSRFNPGESRCRRLVYYDHIVIGDETSSLDEVSPQTKPSGVLLNPMLSTLNQAVVSLDTSSSLAKWEQPADCVASYWPSDSGVGFVDIRRETIEPLKP